MRIRADCLIVNVPPMRALAAMFPYAPFAFEIPDIGSE
jgi:hypothetical protein